MMDLQNAKKHWVIRKYKDAESFRAGLPFEVSEFDGNLMLNEGIAVEAALLTGGAGTPYSNANAHLGVGDSAAAESATQTGLQGTNTAFAPMDTGFPTITGQTIRWQAIFDGNTANFAWNEFTITNAADDTGDNLNRKVSAQGTKTAGQIWTLYIDITFS